MTRSSVAAFLGFAVLAAWLGTGGPVQAQVAPPLSQGLPADPAFDQYVDLDLVADAWEDKDAALLTDLALSMAEGERILQRPRKGLAAADVFGGAIKTAAELRDAKALDRLASVLGNLKRDELVAQVSAARKLASASRAADPGLSVQADIGAPGAFFALQSVLDDIASAKIAGDREALRELAKEIPGLSDLSETQRRSLARAAAEALEVLPADVDPSTSALNKLLDESRRGGGGGGGARSGGGGGARSSGGGARSSGSAGRSTGSTGRVGGASSGSTGRVGGTGGTTGRVGGASGSTGRIGGTASSGTGRVGGTGNVTGGGIRTGSGGTATTNSGNGTGKSTGGRGTGGTSGTSGTGGRGTGGVGAGGTGTLPGTGGRTGGTGGATGIGGGTGIGAGGKGTLPGTGGRTGGTGGTSGTGGRTGIGAGGTGTLPGGGGRTGGVGGTAGTGGRLPGPPPGSGRPGPGGVAGGPGTGPGRGPGGPGRGPGGRGPNPGVVINNYTRNIFNNLAYLSGRGGFMITGRERVDFGGGLYLDPGDEIVSIGSFNCGNTRLGIGDLIDLAVDEGDPVMVVRDSRTGELVNVSLAGFAGQDAGVPDGGVPETLND